MRYDQDGNLARPLEGGMPYVLPEKTTPPSIIEAQKQERRQALQREAAVRKEYKAAGRLHAQSLARLLLVFSLLAAAVGLTVWRSAKITEMSFLNAGLGRQIRELEEQNAVLQDRVSGKASLFVAREEAVSQLGMQTATSGQIYHLSALDLNQGQAADTDGLGLLMSDQDCLDLVEKWTLDQEKP